MANRRGAIHSVVRRTGVPRGWREACVGELADFVGGGTPNRQQSDFWRDGTVPWITPTDLTINRRKFISGGAENISKLGLEHSNTQLVPPKSIVFSTRGTVGNLALAANPLACNQSCEILIPRAQTIDPEFLYYLLSFGHQAFIRLSGGTTFDAITRGDLSRVKFAVPSTIDEQAAIARILDAVDMALERTRKAIENVYILQAAILEDEFANLEAEHCHLGTFATEVRYGTSVASNDNAHGNPVLRIPNVVGDRLALDNLAFVDLSASDVERLELADGDLLLVRTNGNPNYVGRSVVFRHPDNRTWVYASYLIRVRLKDELVPDFVNSYLGLEQGRKQLLQRVTTSAGNHNINANSIKLIRLPVPHPAEQERLAELVTSFRNQSDALVAMFDALRILKESLMYDLYTGRIRVCGPTKASAP